MEDNNEELKKIMEAQTKCCEYCYNLPKRDLALQISSRINHENIPELLIGADKVMDWINGESPYDIKSTISHWHNIGIKEVTFENSQYSAKFQDEFNIWLNDTFPVRAIEFKSIGQLSGSKTYNVYGMELNFV